jgi:hypothetical protein
MGRVAEGGMGGDNCRGERGHVVADRAGSGRATFNSVGYSRFWLAKSSSMCRMTALVSSHTWRSVRMERRPLSLRIDHANPGGGGEFALAELVA